MTDYRTILEINSGSTLYGTNTPLSDTDKVGIFIGTEKTYFGLETVEELDLSIKDKQENGKNTKNAIDRKLYELKNFMKLALQNNPNILEILFCNQKNIVSIDYFGEELLKNKHIFPWKGAKQRFLGYSFSQRHKMHVKKDNIKLLKEAFTFFEKETKDQETSNKLLAEYRTINKEFITFYTNNCSIADLNFNLKVKIKDVATKIKDRIDKFSNRVDLIEKFLYDTKYAMHLIRLLLEGIELLQTGNITFPLKDRELLINIKEGKYSLEDIIKLSEDLERQVFDIEIRSKLPSKPRYDEINNLLIAMIKKAIIL